LFSRSHDLSQSSSALRIESNFNSLLITLIVLSALPILILLSWDVLLMLGLKLAPRIDSPRFEQAVQWLSRNMKEKAKNKPRSLSAYYRWKQVRVLFVSLAPSDFVLFCPCLNPVCFF
jgi:hypothetical protein